MGLVCGKGSGSVDPGGGQDFSAFGVEGGGIGDPGGNCGVVSAVSGGGVKGGGDRGVVRGGALWVCDRCPECFCVGVEVNDVCCEHVSVDSVYYGDGVVRVSGSVGLVEFSEGGKAMGEVVGTGDVLGGFLVVG